MADFAFQQPMDRGKGRNPDDPAGLPLEFDPDSEKDRRCKTSAPLRPERRLRVSAGFTISAIVTAGSGRPYNILAGPTST